MAGVSSVLTRCLIVFVLCSFPTVVDSAYKRWIKNTDFDNPSNWDTGSLPCPKDNIIFPSISPIVSINQDWTITHMVLPSDGIIVFNSDVVISFNENATLIGDCVTPKDIMYNYTLASHWLDPSNWCLPQHDFDSLCFEDIFQLHTEKVPCQQDQVIFSGFLRESHRSSFFVNLDIQSDMNISSLQIGSLEFTTESFQEYIDSPLGHKEFVRGPGLQPPVLHMTRELCYDAAGCYCGTNQSPWKERLCDYAEQDCQISPGICPTPVTPTGHCCPICGSYLTLTINTTSYSRIVVTRMLEQEFIFNKDKDYRDVKFSISRVNDDQSQITLVTARGPNNDGQMSSNMASELYSLLQSDASSDIPQYGILEVSDYQNSSPPQSTPSSSTSSSTSSTASTPIQTKHTLITSKTASTAFSSSFTTQKPPDTTRTTNTPIVSVDSNTQQQRDVTAAGSSSTDTLSDGLVVGIVLLSVAILFVSVIIAVCLVSHLRCRRSSSLDPLAVSIKYEENNSATGNGSVEIVRGLENPCYDGHGPSSSGAANSMQMDEMNGGSVVKAATKKKASKKKSNGFENPVYFDNKESSVATIGAVNGVSNGTLNISNPLYDDTCLDEIN